MSWDGRELISQTLSNGTVLSYAYNSSGIRTQKTYGTSYRKDYLLDGTTIVAEIKTNLSNNSKETIYYFYDETGVAGFEYNGAKYHYIKNLQGDIISIQNANGIVVVNYAYDAWGNVLSISGTSAVIIGTLNPFRYRGYYYDTETGYYYLNSRYYDPVVGRFLNADGYVSTGQGILGNNMYAYCGNNPVAFADSTGKKFYLNIDVGLAPGPDRPLNRKTPHSSVGNAKAYKEIKGGSEHTSPNCYSFAIGLNSAMDPGEISGMLPTDRKNVEDVADSIEADLNALGYTVRRLSGPDSKLYDNEYKIALRVGTKPIRIIENMNPLKIRLVYDYHLMVETETGQWAEKHGSAGDSILWPEGMTPDTIPWTIDGTPYYDSKIIYLAVGE